MKKLQLFLSHNGVASRRKSLDLIQEGKVTVNGEVVTEPSTLIDPEQDEVRIFGRRIGEKEYRYLMLNKPAGYVTTSKDPHAEQTIYELIPKRFHHLKPVGRLDKDTEGLLILTNDGQLANQMAHPRFHKDKVYIVGMNGEMTPDKKKRLEKGVKVDGARTLPAKIDDIQNSPDKTYSEFVMTIQEGRNRQIKKMVATLGHRVKYLQRIAQCGLQLKGVRSGEYRQLTSQEMQILKKT